MVAAASLVDAVEFECNFNDRFHSVVTDIYTCEATVTSCASTTLEDVTGEHLSGRTNYDVKALWIEGQNMPFIPQGISSYFENLIALTIFSDLRSIKSADLQPFPLLEHLFFYGHEFETLDGDLFLFTPRLKYVYMGFNGIKHIGENLLTNLDDLQEIHFLGNICIQKSATTRDEVIKLGLELSVLCPPPTTTTTQTTTTATTTQTTSIQSTSPATTESTTVPTTTKQETTVPTTTKQQVEQCSCTAKTRKKIKISESKTLTLGKCIRRVN